LGLKLTKFLNPQGGNLLGEQFKKEVGPPPKMWGFLGGQINKGLNTCANKTSPRHKIYGGEPSFFLGGENPPPRWCYSLPAAAAMEADLNDSTSHTISFPAAVVPRSLPGDVFYLIN